MNDLFLCNNNHILIKGLCSVLRDDKSRIDIVECLAFTLLVALRRKYKAAIIDSRVAGLSSDEATLKTKNYNPDIQIVLIGNLNFTIDDISINKIVEPNEIQHLIHNIYIHYSLKMEDL